MPRCNIFAPFSVIRGIEHNNGQNLFEPIFEWDDVVWWQMKKKIVISMFDVRCRKIASVQNINMHYVWMNGVVVVLSINWFLAAFWSVQITSHTKFFVSFCELMKLIGRHFWKCLNKNVHICVLRVLSIARALATSTRTQAYITHAHTHTHVRTSRELQTIGSRSEQYGRTFPSFFFCLFISYVSF